MKYLIMVNSILYNRGSEALIRGLIKMIKEKDSNAYITLMSREEKFSNQLNIEGINKYVKRSELKHHSIKNYLSFCLRKVCFLKGLGLRLKYENLYKEVKNQDYIYVVGADNYDITYNAQSRLYEINSFIKKNTKAKMVLYDCSLAQRDITNLFLKDVKNFDCITVRENLSFNNLSKFISNVLMFPDPAFIMDKESIRIPTSFYKNAIGINLSDLILNNKYGSSKDNILKSYKNLIEYILNNTNSNICFIPHVMNGADLKILKYLYSLYSKEKRIKLIDNENLNAMQLKYIISKLDFLVTARTHASIAAYSSCVPTLVLGYSIKSRGIAKDLFGSYDNYVLNVKELNDNEQKLTESFIYLYDNKEAIKKQLTDVIPSYISKAKSAVYEIEKFCDK